jgi:hypothetical protein
MHPIAFIGPPAAAVSEYPAAAFVDNELGISATAQSASILSPPQPRRFLARC